MFSTIWFLQVFSAAFLAILFLQSGVDKVVDRAGNISWLQGHFAQSPLASIVSVMVTVVTVVELGAGGASALGCVALFVGGGPWLAWVGALLSCLALLMLFFGQRLAKDYEGAAVLVPYFAVSLIAVYVTG
jgi:hypothetical protein